MTQDEATLLFANDAFYAAFTSADMDAMDALWAKKNPVSCIHPGAPILINRTVIMESWRAIFKGDEAPQVVPYDATPMVVGNTGWVTCLEQVGEAVAATTNIFVKEDDQWKMTHHQAGITTAKPKGVGARPNQTH
ncbi:nuclear transport factor 2 family protein [Magnetovibrio sp. PR-2]|uniref:nuclear transport factor 2 family protein n=1 Tax=Magnetovibrio sp. PR-2 TaxID=3120356 RepID=UPI002FCE5ED5